LQTNATATDDTNEIGGVFDMTLTAKPGEDLKKVEKAADEELQNFLKKWPHAGGTTARQDTDSGHYARLVERIGGFGGKSDLLARCQTYTGNADCYKEGLKQIQAATPASVKKAAMIGSVTGITSWKCSRIPLPSRPTPSLNRTRNLRLALPCHSAFQTCSGSRSPMV